MEADFLNVSQRFKKKKKKKTKLDTRTKCFFESSYSLFYPVSNDHISHLILHFTQVQATTFPELFPRIPLNSRVEICELKIIRGKTTKDDEG